MKKSQTAPFKYPDHKEPVTRREFLAAGCIGLSAVAFTSGLNPLIGSSNAFGAVLGCSGQNLLCGNIPFLCLDGAGGMNIAGGNALVGFSPNQFQEDFSKNILSDYRRLGVPDFYHPSKTGMVNSDFGLKFHSTSGILEGMNEVLAPRMGETTDLREHVDGLIICALTSDDTTSNPLNTSYMAQKAGAIGDLVQLIGNGATDTGGSSTAPSDQIDLSKKPSLITNYKSSESLLSIGDNLVGPNLLSSTSAGGAERMKGFMGILSRAGKGFLNEIKKNPRLAAEVDQYQAKQTQTLGIFDKFSPAELNPNSNVSDKAIIESVYGKQLSEINGSEQTASNILNLLTKRTAGAATIAVGGCDYHDATAMSGYKKDKEIGQYIGQAIRMASMRSVPIFIHLFTDGGVTGDIAGQVDPTLPSRVVWRSDSGERSAALMIVFNPNKKRVSSGPSNENSNFLLTNRTRQIGYFKAGGGVVLDAHSLGNNSQKLWTAILLNYLATLINSTDEELIIREVGEKFREKFGSLPNDWQSLIRFKSLVA